VCLEYGCGYRFETSPGATADPKRGPAAALRNAMLAHMNDKSGPLNAYPAFWGPFSIIGEGAARSEAQRTCFGRFAKSGPRLKR
jgi:hypothetical protein